jgi:hypothetical protein
MQQAQYALETATIRRLAADPECRFRWTKHALERMAKRGIHAQDVVNALITGQVLFHEIKEDTLYRVNGRDLNGQRLQVQIAVFEDIITIKVVTAF